MGSEGGTGGPELGGRKHWQERHELGFEPRERCWRHRLTQRYSKRSATMKSFRLCKSLPQPQLLYPRRGSRGPR